MHILCDFMDIRKAQFLSIGYSIIYLLMPKTSGKSLIPLVRQENLYSNANSTLSVLYTLVQIDLARHFLTADFDSGWECPRKY